MEHINRGGEWSMREPGRGVGWMRDAASQLGVQSKRTKHAEVLVMETSELVLSGFRHRELPSTQTRSDGIRKLAFQKEIKNTILKRK